MSIAMRRRAWLTAPVLACSLFVACGDDDNDDDDTDGRGDSSVDGSRPDGATPGLDAGLDSSIDATVPTGDGGPSGDGGSTFAAKIITAQISATGRDIFYGVTHDSAGNIYAVGQTELPGLDFATVVAKFNAAGDLQTSFGTNGYAIKNVIAAPTASAATTETNRTEQGRGIVVQPSGKIVVVGWAEHAALGLDAGVSATDTDIVLLRFAANGTLDPDFGTAGVLKLDLSTAVVTSSTLSDGGVAQQLRAPDRVWSISQSATDGKLIVHGEARDSAPTGDGGVRTDADFALVRLTADGQLDTQFGGDGIVLTDYGAVSTSARAATLLANGDVVGAGYSRDQLVGPARPGANGMLQDPQNPWIYKVKANGTPDGTFGGTTDKVPAPGIWHDYARSDEGDCEAYGAAPQGDKFVTLGYGRSPNQSTEGTDWVWFRFNSDGTRDSTWGTNGQTFQDPGGFGDNGRALITLPDNRVLGVGGGRPARAAGATGTPGTDGMIGVLTAAGQPDLSFGPVGARLVDIGGGSTDFLWNVDLAPDKKSVAAVGIGGKATDADDEDGVLVIFPVP